MDWSQFLLFISAAVALLGSPGPAIAALLAVGRAFGWLSGFRFYLGLQVGLGAAAFLTAVGLFSMLSTVPGLTQAMAIIATLYLLYLAWKIASSPVGKEADDIKVGGTHFSGFVVGITNPKAYLAFASLFASFTVSAVPTTDLVIKLVGVVGVMLVVDFAWLLLGVSLNKVVMAPSVERAFNVLLGAMVAVAAALAAYQ